MTVPALVAINLLFGPCGQLVDVTAMVIRQAVTPAAVQGRVVATINSWASGCRRRRPARGGVGCAPALLVSAAGMVPSPLVMVSPLARLGPELPSPSD